VRLAVVIIEDEAPVRDALARDLAVLVPPARIEVAEDVEDARALLQELRDDGDELALVLADHRLPGTSGVDYLVELHADAGTRDVRKVLVTGQADLDDTVRAVNRAELAHYVAKPWDPDDLVAVTRHQLTLFVLETGLDPLPHLRALETETVLPLLRRRTD